MHEPTPTQNTQKRQLASTLARKKRVAQALKVNLQRRKATVPNLTEKTAFAADEEQLPKQ